MPEPELDMEIVVIGADGSETRVDWAPPEHPWNDGDPVPHMSQTFDDPMGQHTTPEQWKELLTGAAREAPDEEQLVGALLCSVGRDLVMIHGVPPYIVEDNVTAFGKWLYAEYHDAAQHA